MGSRFGTTSHDSTVRSGHERIVPETTRSHLYSYWTKVSIVHAHERATLALSLVWVGYEREHIESC
jgi:hypothetical protein